LRARFCVDARSNNSHERKDALWCWLCPGKQETSSELGCRHSGTVTGAHWHIGVQFSFTSYECDEDWNLTGSGEVC
jgi:hypothetical protein